MRVVADQANSQREPAMRRLTLTFFVAVVSWPIASLLVRGLVFQLLDLRSLRWFEIAFVPGFEMLALAFVFRFGALRRTSLLVVRLRRFLPPLIAGMLVFVAAAWVLGGQLPLAVRWLRAATALILLAVAVQGGLSWRRATRRPVFGMAVPLSPGAPAPGFFAVVVMATLATTIAIFAAFPAVGSRLSVPIAGVAALGGPFFEMPLLGVAVVLLALLGDRCLPAPLGRDAWWASAFLALAVGWVSWLAHLGGAPWSVPFGIGQWGILAGAAFLALVGLRLGDEPADAVDHGAETPVPKVTTGRMFLRCLLVLVVVVWVTLVLLALLLGVPLDREQVTVMLLAPVLQTPVLWLATRPRRETAQQQGVAAVV